jgi:hypothetical protein
MRERILHEVIRMTRQHSFPSMGFSYPPRRTYRTWRKEEWIRDEFHPQGVLADVTPRPGHTFTASTYPPRGRGRGESLSSPRRIEAKMRASRVLELRMQGHTWEKIAQHLGYRDRSGPYRAAQRVFERIDMNDARRAHYARYS